MSLKSVLIANGLTHVVLTILITFAQDEHKAFAEQPLDVRRCPDFLRPSTTSTLKPPLLRYGWRVGALELLEIVVNHFPDAIDWAYSPDDDDHEE